MASAQHPPIHAAQRILALFAVQGGDFFDPIKRHFAAAPENIKTGGLMPVGNRIIAPFTGGDLAAIDIQQVAQFRAVPHDPLGRCCGQPPFAFKGIGDDDQRFAFSHALWCGLAARFASVLPISSKCREIALFSPRAGRNRGLSRTGLKLGPSRLNTPPPNVMGGSGQPPTNQPPTNQTSTNQALIRTCVACFPLLSLEP